MTRSSTLAALLMFFFFALAAAPVRAQAPDAIDLSLALDLLVGHRHTAPAIPADDPLLTQHAIPSEYPSQLLIEVPDRPFHDLSKPPRKRVWWKYPAYAVFGLPRDVVDGAVGALAQVPLVSPLVVYPVYEVVPTQYLIRHHSDFHNWPGTENKQGHGMLDSDSWGWFPSANHWGFTREDADGLRRLQRENAVLRAQLDELNRSIERRNQAIADRSRQARLATLLALDAGDFREAAARIVPYDRAYPLDEDIFARLVTALAAHAPEGPEWVEHLLWHKLYTAQPMRLEQARRALERYHVRNPGNSGLARALVYVYLRLGDSGSALSVAMGGPAGDFPAALPAPFDPASLDLAALDPARRELVFETAIAAGETTLTQRLWPAVAVEMAGSARRELAQARLFILNGRLDSARELLGSMLTRDPADPYANYYQGMLDLDSIRVQPVPDRDLLERTFAQLEQAALTTRQPVHRERAMQGLALARAAIHEYR